MLWDTPQQQKHGYDANTHLKFTGVDAAMAILELQCASCACSPGGLAGTFVDDGRAALSMLGLPEVCQQPVAGRCYFTL